MNNIRNHTLNEKASLADALKLIDTTGTGFCFVVADNFKLIGVLTDGDIRRALLDNQSSWTTVNIFCNRNFQYGLVSDKYDILVKRLDKKIKFLPILDTEHKLVSFVTNSDNAFIPVLEPKLGIEELNNVIDCVTSGWISSNGKYVEKFEREFTNLHDGRDSVAVSNGTVALHLALVTLGVGPGDEVIVPSLTFAASAAAIIHAGATPVFCDCDTTLCIDSNKIKKLITTKTKAILVVHLYGRIADVTKIKQIADTFNLLLVEDAAEALGSSLDNNLAGTFGDAATFSFFGNKTITTGEGGMVLFSNDHQAQKAKILRDHGMSKSIRYWHEFVGFNYRMTNIQASIGVAQLSKLSQIIGAKRKVLKAYTEYFSGQDMYTYYSSERMGEKNSNWLYSVIFNRDVDISLLMENLNKKQIDTRPIFHPLHLMPPYSHFKTSENMENTMKASKRGICLPSSATLKKHEVKRIIENFDATIKAQMRV